MSLQTDLRYLRRSTVRSLGPAVAVWACTAIWIAVAPAFLALLGVLQWKSLPFPDSGRVVEINAGLDLVPALAASRRFAAVAGYSTGWANAEGPRGIITVVGAAVDDGFFPVLGTRALQGRVFTPAARATDVDGTVITASLCRRLFGATGPPAGGTVLLAGRRFAVLGVVPDQPVFTFDRGVTVVMARGRKSRFTSRTNSPSACRSTS